MCTCVARCKWCLAYRAVNTLPWNWAWHYYWYLLYLASSSSPRQYIRNKLCMIKFWQENRTSIAAYSMYYTMIIIIICTILQGIWRRYCYWYCYAWLWLHAALKEGQWWRRRETAKLLIGECSLIPRPLPIFQHLEKEWPGDEWVSVVVSDLGIDVGLMTRSGVRRKVAAD